MTDWITTLYERYLQLFGDPDAPVNQTQAATAARPPTEKPVSQAGAR